MHWIWKTTGWVARWHQLLQRPLLSVLLGVQVVFVFGVAPLASVGVLSRNHVNLLHLGEHQKV